MFKLSGAVINTVRSVFPAASYPCAMASSSSGSETIYQFSAKTIDGQEVSLEKYRYVVIQNSCSDVSKWSCVFNCECGVQLQDMHTRLVAQGLRILAFPCNQFGHQEPGSEADIKEFVQKNFGVQFDMFSKIEVNGSNAHPLFKFLKSKLHGTMGDAIKWNFSKFLIDREGKPYKRYSPTTEPYALEADIQQLLNQK